MHGQLGLRESCKPGAHLARLVLLSALSIGGVPVLTSPPGEEVVRSAADWTAPENSWDSVEELPASIEAEGFLTGETPPDVRLRDQFGDEVSLWQFYGKVVALDVSTIWCGPCQEAASHVQEIADKYADEGFVFLSVLPEDISGEVPEQDDLEYWSERHGITEPILSDDQRVAYEIEPNQAWPRILVIDRTMTVVENPVTPSTEKSAVEEAIEAAL